MRGLRAVAFFVGVLVVGAASYGLGGSAEAGNDAPNRSRETEVRRAFETAFDQRRSLDERLARVEDGRSLRSTFESIPKQVAGVEVATVRPQVLAVRLHGNKAEVRFTLEAATGDLGSIGPPIGVAVREHGRWKVSRFTMCTFIELAGTQCPVHGGPRGEGQFGKPFVPPARTENGRAVVPVTFPDGTTAEVVFPGGVDASVWAVQPELGMRIDDDELVRFNRDELYPSVSHRPELPPTLARYRGRGSTRVNLDYSGQMNFHTGDWVVSIDGTVLSERQRQVLARSVRVRVRDGFPVLEARGPVELFGREARQIAAVVGAGVFKGDGRFGPGASDHAQLRFVPKDAFAPSTQETAPIDTAPPPPLPPDVSIAAQACNKTDAGELHVDSGESSQVPAQPAPSALPGEQVEPPPATARRCVPGTGMQITVTTSPPLVAARLATETEIRNVRRR